MSEKILFIEIFQPFAQYRNPFTFYYAQTYPLPPKTTIIGMLQNAINDWYGNSNPEAWERIKVSIHGIFESVFWNYQSLIKGEISVSKEGILINKHGDNVTRDIGTYLPLYGKGLISKRSPVFQQELFNGHLYLFLKGDGNFLEKIKESLENPQKILYLGRSEDVVFIRDVRIFDSVDEEEIIGDIRLFYPTYLKKYVINERGEKRELPILIEKYPVYNIPVKSVFVKNDGSRIKHKCEIIAQKEKGENENAKNGVRRVVEFETVIYTGEDYLLLLKDHENLVVEILKLNDKNKEFRIIKDYGWL